MYLKVTENEIVQEVFPIQSYKVFSYLVQIAYLVSGSLVDTFADF